MRVHRQWTSIWCDHMTQAVCRRTQHLISLAWVYAPVCVCVKRLKHFESWELVNDTQWHMHRGSHKYALQSTAMPKQVSESTLQCSCVSLSMPQCMRLWFVYFILPPCILYQYSLHTACLRTTHTHTQNKREKQFAVISPMGYVAKIKVTTPTKRWKSSFMLFCRLNWNSE